MTDFEVEGANTIPSLHPFAAKMAPSIAYIALKLNSGPLRVLDPMVGSGTTLYVAKQCGHHAIGFDFDPLAVLISQTSCSNVTPTALRDTSQRVLTEARELSQHLSLAQAYPKGADEETKRYIRFWFDGTNRRQLAALTATIRQLQTGIDVKRALWVVLSGTIITKRIGVSLAADVSHSRPHKVYAQAPIQAFDAFERRARKVASVLRQQASVQTGFPVTIQKADARKLPLSDTCIDLVITSPPYVNAIDYLRGHKLSLVWMGYNLSHIRSINRSLKTINPTLEMDRITNLAIVGVRKSRVSTSVTTLVNEYVLNMSAVLQETTRVLVPGGKAILVIGNPTIKGYAIDTGVIFQELGSINHLVLTAKSTRAIPENRRYLPAPSYVAHDNPLSRRLSEETILTFTKGPGAPPVDAIR